MSRGLGIWQEQVLVDVYFEAVDSPYQEPTDLVDWRKPTTRDDIGQICKATRSRALHSLRRRGLIECIHWRLYEGEMMEFRPGDEQYQQTTAVWLTEAGVAEAERITRKYNMIKTSGTARTDELCN